MSEKQPPFYQYPKEIQREYHLLMNSKETFLRQANLSPAENRKLGTLYEELENVWNQNYTEELSKHLERNSLELRKIQKEIEGDFTTYEQNIEQQLKEGLNKRRLILEEKSKNLLEQKERFKKTTQTWKEDILQRKKNLKEYKSSINQSANQKLKELKDTLKNGEKLNSVLQNKSEQLKMKKDELLKVKQERENLSLILKKEGVIFQQNLTKMSESLEDNLKPIREELDTQLKIQKEKRLRQIRMEIVGKHPKTGEELKKQYLSGNYSYLSLKDKVVSKDLEKLKDYMIRELTKVGIKYNDFIAKMERNVSDRG